MRIALAQQRHRRRHRVERGLSRRQATRSRVRFPIFGTAGTDDFNYIEMRLLDRKLTSPHCLAVFHGGHTLPPDDVALEAHRVDRAPGDAASGVRVPRRGSPARTALRSGVRGVAAAADVVETAVTACTALRRGLAAGSPCAA